MAEHTEDLRRIQRDIESTRQHAAETLSALERKMSPGTLMDDAISYLRSNQTGRALAGNFRRTIVENPVPIALLAISLSWLAVGSIRGRRGGIEEDFYIDEHGQTRRASHLGGEDIDYGHVRRSQGRKASFQHHTHVESSHRGEQHPPPDASQLVGYDEAKRRASDSAEAFQSNQSPQPRRQSNPARPPLGEASAATTIPPAATPSSTAPIIPPQEPRPRR